MPKSTLSNPRGVRGAASLCAVAALAYLFVQDLLTIFVSALMGMRVQGASLSDPVGFSVATQGCWALWWQRVLLCCRCGGCCAPPGCKRRICAFCCPPLEPGVLPGGVFGAGQRGQPVRRAAGPRAGRYHQQHRAAAGGWICSFVISVCV